MNYITVKKIFRLAFATTVILHFLLVCGTSASNDSRDVHKILSCNIRVPLQEDEKSGNGWNDRKELCGDVIARCNGDVICLQECYGKQLDYLKQRLPEFDSYGLARPEKEFIPSNAILYHRGRYELISAGGMWLSETPHIAGSISWDSARPRLANWVHLRDRKSGKELRVWNTHFDHIGQEARREQARVLLEAIKSLEPTRIPQLIVGDLNSTATHPAIKAIRKAGFVDTYGAIHGPEDPGYTAHAFQGVKRATSGKKPGGKIDWIFTPSNVKTLEAEIIRDERDGRYPSDHYFVTAVIELPEKSKK